METKPDTIKISTTYKEEILASHADLFVTIKGSSVISGNEAMKKAKEVSQLVDELTRFGIPAEKIHLQGVRVETSSGALLKSSSANYRLRIRCDELDQIAELLDIITSQKNATLERIDWKYPEEEARERGLESALTKAKSKADKIAASLGVKLLGIYEFIENSYDEEAPAMFQPQAMMMKTRMAAADAEPSLGMDVQHSKLIHVNVEIWYRVTSF
ncbi:MAG: SIMPL domain-containing protein [Anaerolineales bacterium]|nr:SIMPL domain-containing protein [Anaerolineales bacterium]